VLRNIINQATSSNE